MKKGRFYRGLLRPIKHAVGYVFLKILIFKVRILPRKAVLIAARILGGAAYRLLGADRRRAERNIETVFPEKSERERTMLARDCFIYSAMNLVDSCRAVSIVRSEPPLWEIEGEQILRDFYDKYGGGIIITAHIGPFEFIPAIWVHRGKKVAAVGRRLYDERIDRILVRQRERMGIFNIPSDAHPKTVIDIVRKGFFVGTVMDTFTRSVDGMPARFFGKTVRTISAPIALARLMRQPVLPMAIYRTENNRFVLRVWPAVEIPVTGDKNADILTGIERANRVIERMIRYGPEQWIWYHERFRA